MSPLNPLSPSVPPTTSSFNDAAREADAVSAAAAEGPSSEPAQTPHSVATHPSEPPRLASVAPPAGDRPVPSNTGDIPDSGGPGLPVVMLPDRFGRAEWAHEVASRLRAVQKEAAVEGSISNSSSNNEQVSSSSDPPSVSEILGISGYVIGDEAESTSPRTQQPPLKKMGAEKKPGLSSIEEGRSEDATSEVDSGNISPRTQLPPQKYRRRRTKSELAAAVEPVPFRNTFTMQDSQLVDWIDIIHERPELTKGLLFVIAKMIPEARTMV